MFIYLALLMLICVPSSRLVSGYYLVVFLQEIYLFLQLQLYFVCVCLERGEGGMYISYCSQQFESLFKSEPQAWPKSHPSLPTTLILYSVLYFLLQVFSYQFQSLFKSQPQTWFSLIYFQHTFIYLVFTYSSLLLGGYYCEQQFESLQVM